MFAHFTLLNLIQGASPAQIDVMLPNADLPFDISQSFAFDFGGQSRIRRKRRKLMKDAVLALKRGKHEDMKVRLLKRLIECGMEKELRYG